jgi:hypothetical protein
VAFLLDPTGKAKIELAIQAINSSSMNYQKIDASNWHSYFIVPGSALNPFPMFKAIDKQTNSVAVTLTMPQANSVKETPTLDPQDALFQRAKTLSDLWTKVSTNRLNDMESRLKKLREELKKEKAKASPPAAPPARGQQFGGNANDNVAKLEKNIKLLSAKTEVLQRRVAANKQPGIIARPDQALRDQIQQRARTELIADIDDYEKCGSSRINFLGLSDYLAKIVTEPSASAGAKALPVSLDSLVLTSQFQITMDANAGTRHLLRIVPVVQPPVLDFSPDHTHSLKITFSGKKGRAFDSNAQTLIDKCLDRFRGLIRNAADKTKYKTFCESPGAILAESLIEAVDNSKTTGTSSAGAPGQ